MHDTANTCGRRRFLAVLGGVAVGQSVACSDPGGVEPEPIGDVPAGNVSDLQVGTLHAVGTTPVAIGRDAEGVYAMTLTCTHEGCNMSVNGTVDMAGLYCACHGARFDSNGSVMSGPAPDPLVHFAVEVDEAGELTIRGDQRVSPSTRTPIA